MYEGEEVDCSSVVSCGDAPEVLELVEASFDTVSRFVDLEVVGDQVLSGRVARDDGGRAGFGDERSETVAVVRLVSQNMVWPKAVQKGGSLRHVAGLSGRQDDSHRPALGIGGEVYLGGQSASGAPQSLISAPPFPVAACW